MFYERMICFIVSLGLWSTKVIGKLGGESDFRDTFSVVMDDMS